MRRFHTLLSLLVAGMGAIRGTDEVESTAAPLPDQDRDRTTAADLEGGGWDGYAIPRARRIPWGGLVPPVHYSSGTRQRQRRRNERRTGRRA